MSDPPRSFGEKTPRRGRRPYEGFQGTNWDLFMKPFEIPVTGEDPAWAEKMLINRVSVFVAGAGMLFLGLRQMEQREKLLT